MTATLLPTIPASVTARDERREAHRELVGRLTFRETDHAYRIASPCTTCDATGRVDGVRAGTTKKCPTCKEDGSTYVRVPSVTTILGILNKPALVGWAARMAANAVRDELGQLVGCAPFDVTPEWVERLAGMAERAHAERRDAAAEKGSVVHDAIHAYHADFFNAEPPADEEARRAWHAFLSWHEQSGLDIVATERMVLGRGGSYAGRFDLLGLDRHGLWIIDVKTSGGVYAEHVLQCAAYADALRAEGADIAGTIVIHTPAGATEAREVRRGRRETRADFRVFESLLPAVQFQRSISPVIKAAIEPAA